MRDAVFEKAQKTLLVGHIGTPDEVAEAYIFAMKVSGFLLNDQSYNSSTLNVDL